MSTYSLLAKRFALLGLIGAGVGALAPMSAEARSIGAYSGKPVNPADVGCWNPWYDSATNVCGSQKILDIMLPVDGSGSKDVKVSAEGATSSNNVGCQATATNKQITSVWSSGAWQYLPAFGSPQDIATLTVTVPSNGQLYVSCKADPNGRINVVNWTL